jgi:hypothetical protein
VGPEATELVLSPVATVSGAEFLLDPVAFSSVGPAGQIAIAQPQSSRVRVFSGVDGTEIGAVGGRGGGPGEFRSLTSLGWAGDTLWVADEWSQRVSVFGPDLGFVRSVAWTDLLMSAADQQIASILGFSDNRALARTRGNRYVRLSVGSDAVDLGIMYSDPLVSNLGGSFVQVRKPWHFVDELLSDDRGELVAHLRSMGTTEGSVLVELDRLGASSLVQSFSLPSERITRAARDSALARQVDRLPANLSEPERRALRAALEASIPDVAPVVRRALMANDGAVWINVDSTEGPLWIRVARDGTLARLAEPAGLRLVGAYGDLLWLVEPGPNGVPDLHIQRSVVQSTPE